MLLAALALTAAAVAPLQAQFGQNKITYETFDWRVYESPHFDIHYYPALEPFLEDVVSHAESAYLRISKELDHELRFRVPLVIYKTHGEFQQTNITLSELPEGVAAFAEPVQNRMVLPIDLPPDALYELISHELVHIFQYSIFFEGYLGRALRANVPAWLMEGMASYFAKDENNIDRMAIRDAVVNNILPPVQALDVVTFLTYRYGHAIFDYIEQEHGPEGVRNFLFEYRKVLLTNNLEKAFKEAFGYDLESFNRRFNRYLRRKYFPVLLEKKAPEDYGTEIGLKRPGVVTFSPTISPSGELVAALASPKLELDLVVLSAEDGKKISNLTAGWTNRYRNLVAEAFEAKRDLSWSPVGDRVAVFVRREQHWPLLVFDALSGKIRHDITLGNIVQNASPAFSPDGRRVAFEGNRDGVVDLFEVDLETREVRNLTQDDFFDANPWYAADGRTLLYNRRIGSYWKIFSVDVDDPSKKTQLTFGPSSDVQPSYSRDGQRIYYSSDQGQYGVFNIYSLDLGTGDMRQYTDVVGGCFSPVEMAPRNDEHNLVFSAFYAGSFRLYRMPLDKPEREISVAERMAEPLEAEPFEPPLTLQIDEPAKRAYKLKWDIEAPFVSVGVTDDGTFLSNAAVQFSDLLGDHRVQLIFSSVSDFSNYNATYFNLKHRYTWGVSLFDYRDFFLRTTSTGFDRDEELRVTGANAEIQYPLSRYYRVGTSVGFVDQKQAILRQDPASGIVFFDDLSDRFATVTARLTGDTTRYQRFGPFQGKRFHIGTTFGAHLSGDSEGNIVEHRLDFRAYRQATRRSLFAVRLAGIVNTGDRRNSYGFGGLNQLRGFDFRSFAGSNLAWANLEFRFPLIDELNFPVWRLGQIRGLFFLDVGAAWFEDGLWWDPDLADNPDYAFLTGTGVRGNRRYIDANGDGLINPGDTLEFVPEKFHFWDSSLDQLQDGRASYGAGFQFLFLGGLQFNWVWARPMDYTRFRPELVTTVDTVSGFQVTEIVLQPETVDGKTDMEFYIVFDW